MIRRNVLLNDTVQQSSNRDECATILKGALLSELREVCDLNYLDTEGDRKSLIRRILADRWGK